MKVIDDNFQVCADCLPVITYGDASHLDCSYSEAEAKERLTEITAGIAAAGGDIQPQGRVEEFSTSACDCCGSRLAGERHHCVILAVN